MTQTDNARGPDWEGFGRDLLESWPVRDVDGSELFDAALRNGLIAEIPGGYDPDQHIDAEGICPEAGDPWYEYAFHPARADLATQPDPLADPRVVSRAARATFTTAQEARLMDDVKRYAVYDRHLSQGGGHEIEEDPDGDYVKYEDYEALQVKLAEVDAERDNETIKRAGWELEAKAAQAALATAQHALVVWDAAHRTGRNDPLVHAFEVGVEALTAIRALAQEEPTT